MNKDYTATEERIRELVPRLKRLTPGCAMQLFGIAPAVMIGSFSNEYFEGSSAPEQSPLTYHFYQPIAAGGYKIEKVASKAISNFQIIGHPIRLEDVLEAVGDRAYDIVELKSKLGSVLRYLYELWIPGKPFSEQPEETKEFITNLLNP